MLDIAIRSLYVTCQFPAAPLPHKYLDLSVLLHPYQVHASPPKTYPIGYASPTTNLDTIAIPQKGQFLSIRHKMHRAFKLNHFQLSDKKPLVLIK